MESRWDSRNDPTPKWNDPDFIQDGLGKGITPVSGHPQVETVKNRHFVGISLFRSCQTSGDLELSTAALVGDGNMWITLHPNRQVTKAYYVGMGLQGRLGDNFAELRRVRIRALAGIKYKDKLNRMFAYDLVNNFNPNQHSLRPILCKSIVTHVSSIPILSPKEEVMSEERVSGKR